MLILGDLSGIQDFLFDVRESGGKQAATLRFRSLRLQLIAECIARRVLWSLDLPEAERLLYCAAGKFAIEATGAASIDDRLDPIRADIEIWLLNHTHGRLRCTIVADDSLGTAAERIHAASTVLQRGKLQAWASVSRAARPLVVPASFDLKGESDCDVAMGNQLKNATTIEFVAETADPEWPPGVALQCTSRQPGQPRTGRSWLLLDRIARHTPRHPDGSLVEFVDLARRSTGAPMLGVLKADADSLGDAIRKRLGSSQTFAPLTQFSQKLDTFFGQTLGREMVAAGSRWNNIYTVFAGGDDLLLVGPWDTIIDFAAHVRKRFTDEFTSDRLTLSAGCAIIKPKFPIHLAARQAEDLLETAKAGPKDQFAALGEVWRWDCHAAIINAGKQLRIWVASSEIQRGWLHTVLELALLQCGQAHARGPGIIPAMASSRLAYHVARNWPKTGAARQWIDGVLKDFDGFRNTSNPIILHLPAIIRYAMLATRSPSDKE